MKQGWVNEGATSRQGLLCNVSDNERDEGSLDSVNAWICVKALRTVEVSQSLQGQTLECAVRTWMSEAWSYRMGVHPGVSGRPRCPAMEDGRAGDQLECLGLFQGPSSSKLPGSGIQSKAPSRSRGWSCYVFWQGGFPADGREGIREALLFLGAGCILNPTHTLHQAEAWNLWEGQGHWDCGLCCHSAPYCQFSPTVSASVCVGK